MDKLQQLIDRCKAGLYLTVNEHRMEHATAEAFLDKFAKYECPPEIPAAVRAGIIQADTIIDLVCYPNNTIGSYRVVNHDLDAAAAEMLEAIG